jgi:hypothetical protein
MKKGSTLDYAAPPEPPKPSVGVYWFTFVVSWFGSVPIANRLDHYIKMRLTGEPADGGVTFLSLFAVAPAMVLAFMIPRKWWIALLIGGLCSPFAVVAMYCLWR